MSSTAGKTGTSDISDQHPEPIATSPHAKSGNYLKLLRQSLTDSARKCQRELGLEELLENHPQLQLKPLTGRVGLDRKITRPHLQRLGLALTGYDDDQLAGGLAWIGNSETQWLHDQSADTWSKAAITLARQNMAGLLVSPRANLPDVFIDSLTELELPLLETAHPIPKILSQIEAIMSEQLSPQICFHGNLLVISGLGVLILGKSGIGKSDDALDLIMHGHQLVADDVVRVSRNPMGKLIGQADELTRHHLTIRGLGIVNIKELFGITAILDSHPIDLILYLEPWESARQYALQQYEELEILEIKMPMMRLPVAQGRNLENLITVAVKTHVLRSLGYDAEKRLTEKLSERLVNGQKESK